MRPEVTCRLAADVPLEHEWRYLLSETYAGELMIVPLLTELREAPAVSSAFRRLLDLQIEEEIQHAQTYQRLLGLAPDSVIHTTYAEPFADYVRSIESVTLRVFALQSMLEGLSLGALRYRLKHFNLPWSQRDDEQIYADELGHTRFGYGYFESLISAEGVVSVEDFRRVSRASNRIFGQHFNGSNIATFLSTHFGDRSDADAIEKSAAIGTFRRESATIIASTKREFLSRYQAASRGN